MNTEQYYSKLITFDENNKLVFHQTNLNKIIQKIPNNTSLAIMSILGPYRTGKSFLMNLFLDNLTPIF